MPAALGQGQNGQNGQAQNGQAQNGQATNAQNGAPTPTILPTPAVGELSMTVNGSGSSPLAKGTFEPSGNELPLRVDANTTAESLELSKDKPLGYVGRAGGIAPVFWNGELEDLPGGGGQAAVLEVRDVPGVGAYSGQIDLLPGDGGEIAVTLSVTAAVYWAVAALLLGILIAYVVKRWLGVKRVKSELKEKLAEINLAFARATREFAAATAGQPYGAYDVSGPFNAASDQAEKKIGEVSRGFGAGTDSTAHDSATEMLGNLRGVADSWQPFGEGLVGLGLQLAELNSDLPEGQDIWPAGIPNILREPAELLNGVAFESLEKYSEYEQEVTSSSEQLSYWDSLRRQLADYRALQQRLLDGNRSTDEREALEGLEPAMREVANELWRVTSEEELAEQESKDDLLGIEKVLSGFPLPVDGPEAESATRILVTRAGVGVVASGGPGARVERTEPEWAKMAEKLRRRRFYFDLVVAFAAAGLAIFVGLNELYFGKEFGTPADYVNAFLWGGTTEGVMAGLVAALSRIGPAESVLATPATLPQLSGGGDEFYLA